MLSAQDGDGDAYRALLHRLMQPLSRYLKGQLARTGQASSEAEDILQEVLIAIHTHRYTYDGREPFTPWVSAIARYKFRDHLRRSRAITAQLPLEWAEEAAASDDVRVLGDRLDDEKLLAGLSPESARVIRDVNLNGLSIAEAAERQGLSESAAKVRIHRGLKALAATLQLERW